MSLVSVAVCASTDPTNGAGLVADCLTLQALGVYPLGVVMAVTVQDTMGVHSIFPMEVNQIQEQWRVLVGDISLQSVKIGMVANSSLLNALCVELEALDASIPIVIDPVLSSGRGDALSDEQTQKRYRQLYLKQKTVVLTPNYHEFYQIMSEPKSTPVEDLVEQFFNGEGAPTWLVLKGVHAPTKHVIHRLFSKKGHVSSVECERLPGEYHGSGCTFASALAAYLALGESVEQSLVKAQKYTWDALESAFRLGKGQLLPNRMTTLRAVKD